MENKKVWLFLALGLLFGLGLEALKRSGPSTEVQSKWGTRSGLVEDVEEIPRPIQSRIERTRSHFPSGERLGGMDPVPNEEPLPTAQAPNPAAQNVPTVPGAEKPADPNDPNAKKKKKKKKKKKIAADKPNEVTVDVVDKENEKETPDTSGVAFTTSRTTTTGTAAQRPKDEDITDPHEWERLLLLQPDLALTMKFVDVFLKGKISSDAFYKIVEEMLTDGREEMKRMGIVALNATPRFQSFEKLIAFIARERGKSVAKDQAQAALKAYAATNHFNILLTGLQAKGNLTMNFEALKLFQLAAKSYLARHPVATNQPQGQPNNGQTPAQPNGQSNGQNSTNPTQPNAQQNARSSTVTRLFNPFVMTLQLLSTTATDANLRQEAGLTLASLQRMLNPGQEATPQQTTPQVPGTVATNTDQPVIR